jgi:hypothetical protein
MMMMNYGQFGVTDSDRLRFVFDGSVVSHDLAIGATYGDIARMLNQTRRQLHGNPIAIDVTLGYCAPARSRRLDAATDDSARR